MSAKPLHYTSRFAAAALLLILVWLTDERFAFRGTVGREVRLCLLSGALAGAATVLLIPVLIRGDWVQRILALLLIAFPFLALINDFVRAFELLADS
jgi:hypothetical protein